MDKVKDIVGLIRSSIPSGVRRTRRLLWLSRLRGSTSGNVDIQKRRSFEAGHTRRFLLIVDESQEVETALYYCGEPHRAFGRRAAPCSTVIEPQQFQHWAGVKQMQIEEETTRRGALFRLFRRKLHLAGFENIPIEEIVREGLKSEEIMRTIDEDEDVSILVLGAAVHPHGPGPLVVPLAAGTGTFPIPVTVVPGSLTFDEIIALA